MKEWLAQLLAPDEDICRSPKSYNSQVGVPLSMWELAPGRHTLGIFEAGISERGEMARLAEIIRPTHGIFTTLGTAHDAGFASEEEKLGEKLRLFERPGFELLVYCADQPDVHAAVQARALPALAWTRHDVPGAALRFRLKATTAGTTTVRVRLGETAATAHFPAEHLALIDYVEDRLAPLGVTGRRVGRRQRAPPQCGTTPISTPVLSCSAKGKKCAA